MALIHCRTCGNKISEAAASCPGCGEPNKVENKKSSNTALWIVLFVIVIGGGFGAYFLLNNPSADSSLGDTREARLLIAGEMLSQNCQTLANMSSEYIKRPVVAMLVKAVATDRCGCVMEPLKIKLADKYSLEELEALRKQPLHELAEIRDMITGSEEEIVNCLLVKK